MASVAPINITKLLFAILVHILFLLSIFHIYFQSPILQNLPEPGVHSKDPVPVANRVVVFVADGLRAESFLKYGANRSMFLQNIILSKGIFGVSHTRVPTESRPGHVALFAGIYEDPSAVFKGWKKNPVNFDTVFNRSSLSFAWGSPDILPIFSNGVQGQDFYTHQYSDDIVSFSGNSNTSALDTWVFDRVEEFFTVQENQNVLISNKRVVLFLHLLGLDTAGHVHKPYSSLFTENLMIVDKGIHETVNLIENVTKHDQKTAYIFTSDHGMTDKGSHGSGHPTETETPFVAWGAGIRHWKDISKHQHKHGVVTISQTSVPRFDMAQADVTPLISALLGLAVPKNNCGVLSRQYLNASMDYVTRQTWKNAEQLYQQYYFWRQQFSQKQFKWSFTNQEQDYETIIEKLKKETALAAEFHSDEMVSKLDILVQTTLEAIDFYQTYFKYELKLSFSLSMLGWILIVIGYVMDIRNMYKDITRKYKFGAMLSLTAVYGYNSLQNNPQLVIIYFVLPILLWTPVSANLNKYSIVINRKIIAQAVSFVGCIELCVISFFERKVLSVLLIIVIIFYTKQLIKCRGEGGLSIILATVCCNSVLAIFPLFPVVEKDSNNPILLILGVLSWTFVNFKLIRKYIDNTLIRHLQTLVCLLHPLNIMYSIYEVERGSHVPILSKLFSWTFAGTSLCLPLITKTLVTNRLASIIMNLSGIYAMLSLSYEPLFLLFFCMSLVTWILAEQILSDDIKEITTLSFINNICSYKSVDFEDFRRSLIFVIYMLIAFFGTGNMATVSSFDPNWVRFFISTFSPFIMAILVVLKLLIPIFILVCVLKSLQIITHVKSQTLFMIILVICDIMSLNFFFLVKNKGSWLDIGTSISHFVIMQCTTIFLTFLYVCVKFVTEASLVPSKRILLPYSNKINKE
uniref:GPI ethanolamine phosphate transferase 1 n=1 Tax=Culex tarsalis TaxID=7177 RepID=A0A1Q3FC79_CULTA